MKINSEVIEAAVGLEQDGIPVFLGMPNVTSLTQLATMRESRWLHLDTRNCVVADHEIDCAGDPIIPPETGARVVTEEDIIKITQDAQRYTWKSLLEQLRRLRSQSNDRRRFLFGPAYKPVYFLLV